jgi:uncharacterized membrane protein YkgB
MAVADAQGSVCIPNISTSERRKRLIGGIIPFVVALLVLAALLITGTDRWWRVALFPLFWAAGSGFFQWRDRT